MDWGTTAQADVGLGARISGFLIRPQDYVHRIVESITFVGTRRVRREVRFEVDLAPELVLTDPETGEKLALLPLLLVKKTALVDVVCEDETSCALPILTNEECGFVAWSALVAAGQVIKGDLDPEFAAALRKVAWDPAKQAQEVLDGFAAPASPHADLWRQLAGQGFGKLAADFAANVLLVVPLYDCRPRRRAITISYDESIDDLFSLPGWRPRLGLGPAWLHLQVPLVANCRSYQVEVEPPEGLEVFGAVLEAEQPSGKPWRNEEVRAMPRVHLELHNVTPTAAGKLTVGVRAPREGLVSIAAASTSAAAILLAFGAVFHQRLGTLAGNVVAVVALVLAYGFPLAYLVRPAEHLAVSRLLLGLRRIMLGCGLLLLVAAWTIVIPVTGTALATTMTIMAGLATIAAGVTFRGYRAALQQTGVSLPHSGADWLGARR